MAPRKKHSSSPVILRKRVEELCAMPIHGAEETPDMPLLEVLKDARRRVGDDCDRWGRDEDFLDLGPAQYWITNGEMHALLTEVVEALSDVLKGQSATAGRTLKRHLSPVIGHLIREAEMSQQVAIRLRQKSDGDAAVIASAPDFEWPIRLRDLGEACVRADALTKALPEKGRGA